MFWKLPLPISTFICQWLEDGKLEDGKLHHYKCIGATFVMPEMQQLVSDL